jgi:hypothetical protein
MKRTAGLSISASSSSTPQRSLETIREPLLVLTPDLQIDSANRSFYETFQVSPDETDGRSGLRNREPGLEHPGAAGKSSKEIIPEGHTLHDFELNHTFPEHRVRCTCFLNARRINHNGRGTDRILLAVEDMTKRKSIEESLRTSETRYRRLFETAKGRGS